MYSRYGNDSKNSVRLPEHYGGSAFSQLPTEPIKIPKREPHSPIPREGIGEKASPVADRLLRAESIDPDIADLPATPTVFEETVEETEERKTPPIEKSTSASPFNFGALHRLFANKEGGAGEDQDRLLLLGLILLLSRTEGDSDILLWLSLLLLCG